MISEAWIKQCVGEEHYRYSLHGDRERKRCLVLVCHERMAKAARCYIKDEGEAPRNRFEGGDSKPPTAAWVKSPGGERVGKRRGNDCVRYVSKR